MYVTKTNETRQLAVKRKFHELSQDHERVQAVQDILAGDDEDRAIDVFRRLRAGQKAESIIRSLQGFINHNSAATRYDRRLRQDFLIALCQSTASLWEVVQAAKSTFSPETRINLPDSKAFQPLRDYIITLDTLGEVVAEANPDETSYAQGLSSISESSCFVPDGSHDGPLFWVPASPWTTVIGNDEAVSQLVSTFLTMLNPYWRYLEEDLFLRQMRSKNENGLYCSVFLVNTILAAASVRFQSHLQVK